MQAPMPKRLKIGPYTYTVVVDQAEINKAIIDEGQDLFGYCETKTHRILVDPDVPLARQQVTVTHEALHGLMELTGIDDDLGPEVEEKVVSRLAPALVEFIRANPQYVEYVRQ